MRIHARIMVTTVTAIAAFGVSVGTASAGRLSLSAQTFRVYWEELRFSGTPCEVILEGSFHSRTITKTARALIGFITRAIANELRCTRIFILQESLPWHMRYDGFTGTLPNISSLRVNVIDASILRKGLDPNFLVNACLFRSNEPNPLTLSFIRDGNGRLTRIRPVETAGVVIYRNLGDFMSGRCPLVIEPLGDSDELTVLGSSSLITLTLI